MTEDVITALRKIAEQPQPPAAIDLNETVRRGRRRIRRRRVLNGAAGLAVAAAVATVGWLVWPGGSDESTAPASPSDLHVDRLVDAAAAELSLLAMPQHAGGELPDVVLTALPNAAHEVVTLTARPIEAALSASRYWAAVDHAGQICLLGKAEWIEPDSTSVAVGAACAPVPDFADQGVVLDIEIEQGPMMLWLVPNGYTIDDDAAEWSLVHPNLAVSEAARDCHAPVEPSVLPDGSEPGEGEVSENDYGLAFTWGSAEEGNQVVMVHGDPLGLAGLESDGVTVGGGDVRLTSVGDAGEFAIWLRQGGCEYTIWVGPGLTAAEVRAYARTFG